MAPAVVIFIEAQTSQTPGWLVSPGPSPTNLTPLLHDPTGPLGPPELPGVPAPNWSMMDGSRRVLVVSLRKSLLFGNGLTQALQVIEQDTEGS